MKKNLLLPLLLLSSNIAIADPRVHIGAGVGYSIPVVSNFIDKDTDAKVTLTNSRYYHARLGYEFAPSIHIELDGGCHPYYEMSIELPNDAGKVTSKAKYYDIHANLIYDFNPIGIATPFFLFGLGTSHLALDEMLIKHKLAGIEIFKAEKQNSWFKSMNAGVGMNLALGANMDLEIAGKFLMIHDIKVDYKKFDASKSKMVDGEIKKTIATWELGAGLKFKF